MTTELVAAGAGEAGAFARLHAACFDAAWSEADFLDWLHRPLAIACLARIDGEAAGFALALAAGSDAELLTIGVRPDLRGAGLGARLLERLMADARARGLDRMVLDVARDNQAARRLYATRGFAEIAVRPNYYSQPDGRGDALVLARGLGPVPDDGGGGSPKGGQAQG